MAPGRKSTGVAGRSVAQRILGAFVALITCLCLAWSLFGAGLVVCTTKEATNALGSSLSGWDNSALPAEDMAAIAEEVRLYSLGQATTEQLEQTTLTAVKKNYPAVAQVIDTGSLVAGLATSEDSPSSASGEDGTGTTSPEQLANPDLNDLADTGKLSSSLESEDAIKQLVSALGLPDSYAESTSISVSKIESWFSLPEGATKHLADCIPVFVTARGSVVFAALVALAGLIWLGICRGRRLVGWTMIVGAALPLACILIIGIWALADFNGLFAAMHGLFFADGTWTFPADSLLIRLFPEAFWAGMAALWAATSIALGLICLGAGRLIRGR